MAKKVPPKVSKSRILLPTQRQLEDEDIWHFPDIRVAEESDSFIDSAEQTSPKKNHSKVGNTMENNKAQHIDYVGLGGSKKVKPFL